MQAPGLKRTTLSQIVGLALVMGLAASITLNVVMLTHSNHTATQPAAAQVDSIAPSQQRSSATGQIDVMLLQAGQAASSEPSPVTSGVIRVETQVGQIDVLQMQAEQRFAPTARDWFFVAPEP